MVTVRTRKAYGATVRRRPAAVGRNRVSSSAVSGEDRRGPARGAIAGVAGVTMSETIGRHRRGPGTGSSTPRSSTVTTHLSGRARPRPRRVRGRRRRRRRASPEHLAVLRAALGDDAGRVHFHDLGLLARDPARVLPALRMFVDRHGGAQQRVRAVAESCWPGRTPAERAACLQHDALANVAFEDMGLSILCPYDTRGLGEDERADACAAHPHTVEDGAATPNPNYSDPVKLAAAVAGPLRARGTRRDPGVHRAARPAHGPARGGGARPPCGARRRPGRRSLPGRPRGRGQHRRAHRRPRHPLAVGGGRGGHGGDPGRRVRHRPARRPLPAGPTDGRGYGLYLTHRLCDLVRIHTTLDAGTTVRMSMRLRPVGATCGTRQGPSSAPRGRGHDRPGSRRGAAPTSCPPSPTSGSGSPTSSPGSPTASGPPGRSAPPGRPATCSPTSPSPRG